MIALDKSSSVASSFLVDMVRKGKIEFVTKALRKNICNANTLIPLYRFTKK